VLSSQVVSLPDHSEHAANMLDVSHKHTIVGDYSGHNDFPSDDGMPEDFKEIFSIVHEIISRIRR